jgi:hypothetical protein
MMIVIYTWINCHPIRELLRTCSLKDGAVGAKSQAMGRKVRLITDVASTALRREEMAVCLEAIWDEQPYGAM